MPAVPFSTAASLKRRECHPYDSSCMDNSMTFGTVTTLVIAIVLIITVICCYYTSFRRRSRQMQISEVPQPVRPGPEYEPLEPLPAYSSSLPRLPTYTSQIRLPTDGQENTQMIELPLQISRTIG
ncbi:hypothetical protein BCR33DRAFT_765993 [Rhizoclosmatium globosum]|uniref:Uncharacterized protein n=1 Tax=Rhizoclosmatium globosum TaxID=329046 RepID=A0A1Y2CBD9_9FUNG|nr:hypothetical protein BCR33DRAFT_765993 [Rhizoclosmatium globosum]|eukprot:ORY44349.1 hypothetical protein BCR33DRAFT_765993 [Rhizoclosmatium globosum]